MVLRRVILENVKGFKGRHEISFANLNLMYGENSAGKSSVIQSLLLLRQSMDGRHAGLEFRGQAVDAGGFSAFINDHDTQKSLGLGIGIDVPSRRIGPQDLLGTGELKVTFRFTHNADTGRSFLSAIIYANGDLEAQFTRHSPRATFTIDPASAESLVAQFVDGRHARRSDDAYGDEDVRWLRRWIREHPADASSWGAYWDPFEHGAGKAGRPFGGSLGSTRNVMLSQFMNAWGRSQRRAQMLIRQSLSRLVHVGPLREIPRRVATEVGAADEVGSRGESLVLHLSRKPSLVQSINDALRRLEVPYVLSVQSLTEGAVADALGDVAVAILKDTRTGISLSTADVGFGLSQVLPVIAQLAGSNDKVILIEQPEIHLHPGVQSRLGDELLHSVLTRGNQVIAETHSEHILSRIQRRMRESELDFALSTFYFGAGQHTSAVTHLRVAGDGTMLDPWPSGFFDAQADDLFASL